jgi:hypothetical protein
MKNLVLFGALVIFLSSCSNVVFVNPQPEDIVALTEIPEKYHGIYEFEDSTINTDSYLVTDSSVGEFVLGDSLIVKQRGNYFFLNFFEENAYEVYVVKINQSLSYTNIEMLFPNISDNNEHLFNIINAKGQAGFQYTNKNYLIDNVSVNQMNVLLHQPISDDIVKLKRIK